MSKQKISESAYVISDNYIKSVVISRGYLEEIIEFKETLLNGLIIENIGVHAASILTVGYIHIKNYSLSVSLSASIAHPDVHKNIDYSPSYVVLEYPNGNSVKERFSVKGSYMIDSKDRFIGVAKFDLPKNLKDERIIVNIIIQGIYNSGAGLIPSIPRTIKREILCQ